MLFHTQSQAPNIYSAAFSNLLFKRQFWLACACEKAEPQSEIECCFTVLENLRSHCYVSCRNLNCELATDSDQISAAAKAAGFTSIATLSEYYISQTEECSSSAKKIAEKLGELISIGRNGRKERLARKIPYISLCTYLACFTQHQKDIPDALADSFESSFAPKQCDEASNHHCYFCFQASAECKSCIKVASILCRHRSTSTALQRGDCSGSCS